MSKGSSDALNQVATLVDLLRHRASNQPDRVAYQFLPDGEAEAAVMTHAGLDQAARAIATLLTSLNCAGRPVLLLYPPGLDYIAAFFGCVYAGAIAVPAYPPRPNRSLDRLQVMGQDAEATVALTHSTVLSGLEKRLAEHAPLKQLHWLATDAIAPDLADQWQPPTLRADDLALLQYTSGSTGTPKGVMISHGNLLHNSARIQAFFGDTPASQGVSWLPPYHDMGLVGGILQPLYVGAPMALMPPVAFLQKPWRWLQAISRYGATTSGGPNFAYDLCVEKTTPEQRAALNLSRWQLAFSGAEPVRAETLARFAEAFAPSGFQLSAFYPCYGMAETTLMVTGGDRATAPHLHTIDDRALQHHHAIAPTDPKTRRTIVGCGRAAADQPIQIVNPDTHEPCPEGGVGEIWVAAGGSTAQGYWRKPEQTAATFQAHTADQAGPFLRTGDLGFLQGDELFVTGRRKELIIIRGRNYYPKDIEATVEAAHPALRSGAGAAFAITIEGQERLVVVQEVERSALRQLPTEAIVAAVRRAIAEQHELQLYGLQLIKTGSIPKTSSGKIQRYLCRAGYLDNQLAVVHTWQLAAQDQPTPDLDGEVPPVIPSVYRPPVPPISGENGTTVEALQRWLVDWLAQQLQVSADDIDVTRPFAEYGLDSVAAVELTESLQAVIPQPLSPTLAYEYPTVEAVAGYLAQQFGDDQNATTPEPASNADESELADLLSELEGLSDAEVEKLLG